MTPKAFTLVETLIAVAVISLAIIGPFHVAQSVLQSSYTARDQLVASALAQEGLEYVHSVRDGNTIYNLHHSGNNSWLAGVDGANGAPDCYTFDCVVDLGQQTVARYTGSAPYGPLYLSGTNLYTQQLTTNATKFTRKVRLTSISATETHVVVTVTWVTHSTTYSVVLTENLRNWL